VYFRLLERKSAAAKTFLFMHNWHFLALFGYYLVISSIKTFGHNWTKKLCSSYISDLKINHGWRRWRRKNIQIGESCAGQSLRYKPLFLIGPKYFIIDFKSLTNVL
jgi:hypothetical protein